VLEGFPPGLETRTQISEDRVTVVAWGELDVASAPRLAREIRLAEARRPALVVLDLRAVTFFDVAGVHLLSKARSRARERRYSLRIACDGAPVRRVLGLCGFPDGHFEFDPPLKQTHAA
jgi:anti-sigma B factor antagonist